MYYSVIRAAIKSVLDGLSTAGTIGTVYNGEQNKQSIHTPKFPAVEIVRLPSMATYLDNQTDLTNFVFELRIYSRLVAETNQQDAELIGDAAIDSIVGAFMIKANSHLSGLLEVRIEPIESGSGTHTWNGEQVRRDVITLKCQKLVSLT